MRGKAARKKEIFDREFTAFWGGVGSTVEFKHSNKNRTPWEVEHIETDWENCRWSKGQKQPLFITLVRRVPVGGKHRIDRCWTCTSQLREPK